MDAQSLADLLIAHYLSPAAETWDTADPVARWDTIKMAVGVAAGWAITESDILEPAELADALMHHLAAWIADDNGTMHDFIINGGRTGKGGFRGRLAAELVNLGY
jgi:hypothetical protein